MECGAKERVAVSVFGQSKGLGHPGFVVTSVASTLGAVGASGGMEYRSYLIWLLCFVVFYY